MKKENKTFEYLYIVFEKKKDLRKIKRIFREHSHSYSLSVISLLPGRTFSSRIALLKKPNYKIKEEKLILGEEFFLQWALLNFKDFKEKGIYFSNSKVAVPFPSTKKTKKIKI